MNILNFDVARTKYNWLFQTSSFDLIVNLITMLLAQKSMVLQ